MLAVTTIIAAIVALTSGSHLLSSAPEGSLRETELRLRTRKPLHDDFSQHDPYGGGHSCPNSADRFHTETSTCFELVPIRQATEGHSDKFTAAANYCAKRGKMIGAIRSPSQQSFVANMAETAGHSQILIGLRKQRTLWKWIDYPRFYPLANQGCFKTVPADHSGSASHHGTHQSCVEHCRQTGDLFAGIYEEGTKCICSKTFRWTTPSTGCTHLCSGSRNKYCGGDHSSITVLQTIRLPSNLTTYTPDDLHDDIPLSPFEKWSPQHHQQHEHTSICGALESHTSSNRWVTAECEESLPFMCEYESPNQPDLNAQGVYTWSQSKVYVLYHDKQLPFTEANHFCSKHKGWLATVDSFSVMEMINELLQHHRPPYRDHLVQRFWIGITSLDYVWRDGTGYNLCNLWANRETDKHCAVMSGTNSDYGWSTIHCEDIGTSTSSSPDAVLCSGPVQSAFDSEGYAPLAFGEYSLVYIKPCYYQPEAFGDNILTKVGPLEHIEPERIVEAPAEAHNDEENHVFGHHTSHHHGHYLPIWAVVVIVVAVLLLILIIIVTTFILTRGICLRHLRIHTVTVGGVNEEVQTHQHHSGHYDDSHHKPAVIHHHPEASPSHIVHHHHHQSQSHEAAEIVQPRHHTTHSVS